MAGKLFEHCSSKDWRRRTAFVGGPHYEWTLNASYYEAAETLVLSVLQHNKRADLLFCPIVHLYHHFVELAMKHLIRQAEGLCTPGQLRTSVRPALTRTHSLKCLLDWLVERLEVIDDREPFNDKVRLTIEQLHTFNGPAGEATRYAFTNEKKPKRTLPERKQFDIEVIRSRMKEVNEYLCGVEDWLDRMRETE